jgi:hypothetical protein
MIAAGVRAVVGEVPAAWRRAPWPWRFAYAAGTVLMAVGLAHGLAWVAAGGAWEGPVSYRKPFSFGVSFGLATVTLAWVADQLGLGRRAGAWVLVPLVLADTSEVVWVSVQRARGVASHFNFDTPLDATLFSLMGGAAVTVTVLCIVALMITAFRRAGRDPAVTTGIRVGFGGLLAAVAVGVVMINLGTARAAAGQTTELVVWGSAGNMKVTHALGLHGIQILAGLAVFLAGAGLDLRRRVAVVRLVAVSYATVLAAGTLQWFGGRALTEPSAPDLALAVAALAPLGAAVVVALRPRGRKGSAATDAGAGIA